MQEVDYTKPPIVKMTGITKRFPGVLANEDVNLELYSGEVLALLGENGAGKSTLMNMLVGIYSPDEGTIEVNGKIANISNPQDSMNLGIGMIHQEFKLVGNMTVAENVILGMPGLSIVPKMDEIKKKIKDISDRYGLRIDPSAKIQSLTVGEQQRVEILKLIYRGAKILILDEPTAVLTPQESKELNQILKVMLSEGKSAIFISHKMDEILEFSDRVLVLRKGRLIGEKKTKEIKALQELANMMVGKDILFHIEKGPYKPTKDPVIKVEGLTVTEHRAPRPILDNVSLTIKGGEILGIAGVSGNGQEQLAEAIWGLRRAQSGKVFINGKDITNKSPIVPIKNGVSMIPANRGLMGIAGDMSVKDNESFRKYRTKDLSYGPLLAKKKMKTFAKGLIERYDVKTPNEETQIKYLSGGNIQKAILAREIDSCDVLLIAVYPSRGLDVGATEAVRRAIMEERDSGKAVLLISEELEELKMLSDNIAVMFEGRIMKEKRADDFSIEEIGLLMAGVKEKSHE